MGAFIDARKNKGEDDGAPQGTSVSDSKTEDTVGDSTNRQPVVKFVGYSENNPNHVPDPFAQTGTLDTTDSGGGISIESVAPIFDVARAQRLEEAADALDPERPTPSELVILPQGEVTVVGTTKTPEEGRQDVLREVERLRANPVEIGGMNASQRAAAETTGDTSEASSTKDETVGHTKESWAAREAREHRQGGDTTPTVTDVRDDAQREGSVDSVEADTKDETTTPKTEETVEDEGNNDATTTAAKRAAARRRTATGSSSSS